MKRTDIMRVDRKFREHIKNIQKKLAMKGIIVSERRITLALTRVSGQEEYLLNSNWLDEEIRRTKI